MSEDTQAGSSKEATTSSNGARGSEATKNNTELSDYELSRIRRRKYERNVGFSIVGVLFIIAVLGWALSDNESWESKYKNCMIGENRNSSYCEDLMEEKKSTWKSVTTNSGKAQVFSLN